MVQVSPLLILCCADLNRLLLSSGLLVQTDKRWPLLIVFQMELALRQNQEFNSCVWLWYCSIKCGSIGVDVIPQVACECANLLAIQHNQW